MSELDTLEQYLKERGVRYRRIDELEFGHIDRHQIICYDEHGNRTWDAICQFGSYGYEVGALEIMGAPVVRPEDGSSVVGWLSADNVIERLEAAEAPHE